jgi:hypothetical protein
MAASIPINIASDQSAVPISGSITASVTGLTAATTLSNGLSNPTVAGIASYMLACDSTTWFRLQGTAANGLNVQGGASGNASIGACKPMLVGFSDSTSPGNLRYALSDTSGRLYTIATGTDGSTARTIATDFLGQQIVTFAPSNCGPFGDLIAEAKTPTLSRYWTSLNAFDAQHDEIVTQANGATVTVSSGRLTLTTGTTNGADACYRTIKIAQYRPGEGFDFRFTAAFTAGVTNSTQEFGFGNGANGGGGNAVAFGYNGTAFGVLHRNAGSSTWTAQTAWNVDRLDGAGGATNPSGYNLTSAIRANLNLYRVLVPFLGAGDIEFYIQHPSTKQWLLVHRIQYAGSSQSLEFSDPAFRFYGRAVSTGSTTNLVSYAGSVAAFVVGQIENHGQQWAANNTVSVNGTAAVLSIRCATSVNGALNNVPLRIRSISCSSDNGNTTTTFIASLGPTLGGAPAFAAFAGKSATTADNGVTLTSATTIGTVDIAGTTITGGDPIWNTCAPRNSASASNELDRNPLYVFPGQTLTFYATTGAAANVTFAVNGTVG